MKFLLLAPFIALAATQSLDLADLPSCGTTSCLMPAFNSSGCDYLTNIDISCICTSSAVRNALTCVEKECSDSDTDRYFGFANLACIGQKGYPLEQNKTEAEGSAEAEDKSAASGLAVNLGLAVAAAALVAGLV